MAKTRLNQYMRDRLYERVRETVRLPELERHVAETYNKAADHVRRTIAERYPAEDMRLLQKYGYATTCTHPRLVRTVNQTITGFEFEKGDTLPTVPGSNSYFGGNPVAIDTKALDAVEAWEAAVREETRQRERLHGDYRELIRGSRYLEEVVEIWPEAIAVAELAKSKSLVILSDEVIARIRADQAKRKESSNAS